MAHVVYFEIIQASPQASLQSSCDKKDPTTRTDQSRLSVLQRSVGPMTDPADLARISADPLVRCL